VVVTGGGDMQTPIRWLVSVMMLLATVPAAADEPAWGFDGEDSHIADSTWGLQVSTSRSDGCSQSWSNTNLTGHWTLTAQKDEVVLTLELSGTNSSGSWQGGGGASYYDIPLEHWRW